MRAKALLCLLGLVFSLMVLPSMAMAEEAPITEKEEKTPEKILSEFSACSAKALDRAAAVCAGMRGSQRIAENHEAEHQHIGEVSVPPPKRA